ncbi:MAG: sugar transferase [Bacteroidetes bacterium]|nr:sugar transferase [Bacteroidota bacterium]
MIREEERIKSSMFGIYTMILTLLTFIASIRLSQNFVDSGIIYTSEYLALLLLLLPIWFFGLSKTNLFKIYRVNHYLQLLKQSIMFIVLATGILFILINLFNLKTVSKEFILIFAALNQFSIFTSYIAVNQYYMRLRKKGYNLINIVIIADESNENFIQNIVDHREWGYKIMLIITESDYIAEKFSSSIKVLKKISNLPCIIKSEIVDEVFYCKNLMDKQEIQNIVYACEEVGVAFRLQSELLTLATSGAELNHFDGIPFITYKNTPSNQYALSWKYISDFLISSAIIVLWMPLMAAIAIIIKVTSKGPIVFKQKRVGLHGREFYIYKFRTMLKDAEKMQMTIMDQNEMSGPVFKIKNDPRITKVGKFLRRTSLDELPQFFNVIKGDMSLVGPRPPIMSEVKQYKPWQLRRLSMRPGITCTWQTTPKRNSVSFEEWMKMDLQYIDNWSLEKDFILTFKTLRTVFMGSGQ